MILVTAPRHVAVQVLVNSTVAAMKQSGLEDVNCEVGPLQIVHMESEGMTDARYLGGK